MPIPLPPLEEQRRIVAEIERQVSTRRRDGGSHELDRAFVGAPTLRRAILEQAFSGKLVPQDPSDEPASALLERIAAERAAVAEAVPPEEEDSGMSSNGLVQRLWNYCNVLRDDGLSYGDYVEQLTYLLFLKMADEQTQAAVQPRPAFVPEGLDWQSLLARDGDELEVHYRHVLTELGRRPGMLGVVFRKAQNRIQDPAKLRRLIVDLIDRERWMTLDVDVKGDAYEGLLQKNAEDVKTGAGQYFTPRPLIKAIVEVMRPEPGMTICDPACGTGGFLLAAHEYISRNYPYLDPDEKRHLRFDALHGARSSTTPRACA